MECVICDDIFVYTLHVGLQPDMQRSDRIGLKFQIACNTTLLIRPVKV